MAKKQLPSAADQFLENVKEQEKDMKSESNNVDEKAQQQQLSKGQPKKYDEPTKHISFSLPVSIVEDFKILANIRNTNQTQIILEFIKAELKKDADKIKSYKELFGRNK